MLFAMKSTQPQTSRRKRALTLLEIVIAMILLGILLTGLFNVFHQSLKKGVAAKELKQKILQLQLFEQRMKIALSHKKAIWLGDHPNATGLALYISFENQIDPEFKASNDLLGMLYVDQTKHLNFVTWSAKDGRVETLLENVHSIKFRLFDAEEEEWLENWPKKKEELPVMASINLNWNKKENLFVFFLSDPDEQIIYPGSP